MLKVAVTGSWSLTGSANKSIVYRELDEARQKHGPLLLVHGCDHSGPGRYALEWAEARGVGQLRFPPQEGNIRSIFTRNSGIAYGCECLIVFWDGEDRGTLDLMRKVAKLEKPVVDVLEESRCVGVAKTCVSS